jgi:tetratricopeptide (TPR) repeat protein
MIVRDEEEMLARTLAAAAPAVDEIVIVDTGSRDRTIEIAESFGATVLQRDWTGDFSAARNASFDAASGDWILYLDADEVLVGDDAPRLRELAGHSWREAMFIDETNFTGRDEAGISVVHAALRMIRNRPEYRFSGRLHEQIANTLPSDLPERIARTSIRVNHYGYLGVVREAKEKSRRNLDLLHRQLEEGADNAFLHYNLGSEHFALGETAVALAEFETSWTSLEAEPGQARHEFVPSLISRFVKALRAAGRPTEAIAKADEGLERFPGFTDLVYEQGLAALALGREDEARGHLERAIEMGDAPSRYAATVGAGTFQPRIILAGRHLHRGEIEPAVALMQWCIEHHPDFFGVLHPYATALMRAGREAEEIVAEVERRVVPVTATMRFMLGVALFEQGAAETAERQFRSVLEAQPHSGPARAALVETLLYQRRYADAAAEAAALDPGDPCAPAVLRSELFARLLAGDLAGATATLARAGEARLPTAERALYAAWLTSASGAEAIPRLPVEAAPLLEVMLEALLRVRDFESFETVHRLFAATGLPERERRERLAQLYLRRGFVRSAGQEWMAVCETQADARGLVGLAQVALASGRSDTAATFAREALALEPGNPIAQQLLERDQLLAV